MTRTVAGIVLSLLFASMSSPAAAEITIVTCATFSSMPKPDQTVFISGAMNGMGMTFGVIDSFAKSLEARASLPEEKAAIENLRNGPRGFLSRSAVSDGEAIRAKVESLCRTKPEQYAGNALVDVLSRP